MEQTILRINKIKYLVVATIIRLLKAVTLFMEKNLLSKPVLYCTHRILGTKIEGGKFTYDKLCSTCAHIKKEEHDKYHFMKKNFEIGKSGKFVDERIIALVENEQRLRFAETYSLDTDMGHYNYMGYLRDKFRYHYFIDENGYIQDVQDFIAEGGWA